MHYQNFEPLPHPKLIKNVKNDNLIKNWKFQEKVGNSKLIKSLNKEENFTPCIQQISL